MAASRPAAPLLSRLAVAAIVTNAAIVVTGGIVRVTGSGLGCPDWPTCEGTRIVPSGAADSGWHQAIEFGNRLLTFVVLAVAVAVWVQARRVAVDRTDVRRLALALPLGVLAQALLGGITVLTGLHPLIVAAHFLLSAVLIAIATALHHRVRPVRQRGVVTGTVRRLAVALLVLGAAVLALGTLVTAAGPHAGDPDTERLALDIRDVVRLHSGTVWLTVATTVAILWSARRGGADRAVRASAGVLLAVEVLQGAVGYTQYALDIPAELVSVHLALATLFWIGVVRVWLDARTGLPMSASAAERPAVAVR